MLDDWSAIGDIEPIPGFVHVHCASMGSRHASVSKNRAEKHSTRFNFISRETKSLQINVSVLLRRIFLESFKNM